MVARILDSGFVRLRARVTYILKLLTAGSSRADMLVDFAYLKDAAITAALAW